MAKLRLGVLGTAGIYEKRIAIPLRYSEFVEPYAVASRDEQKAKNYAEKWGFPVSYGSYEALLADKKIDFVYIPLPNHLHAEFVKKAADAGKPVICEKPIALTAADAASAAGYCQKKGVPMMEAFMYRFHPQWIRAHEIVRSGEIGDITSVSSFYAYTNLDGNNIRNRVDAGGGCIYDIGCYTVSSARFLFGMEPQRVCCTLMRDAVFKTDVLASAILDFGGGKTAVFTLGTQLSPCQSVTAVGTGGCLSIEVPFNMYEDCPGCITVKTGIGTRHIKTAAANQYLLEFDAFAKAIGNNLPAAAPAMSDSVANMAVLDALRVSAESGCWADVKPCPPLQ
jgi:predicted dehydrogenase